MSLNENSGDDSPTTVREVGYILKQLQRDNIELAEEIKDMKEQAKKDREKKEQELKDQKANQRKMVWTIVTSVVIPILTVLISAILTR